MTAYAQTAATPAPQASPATLPEIGRVRAITPACAAVRDLIIPAFQTVRKVDVRFEKNAAPLLPQYMQAVDDGPLNPVSAMRLSLLDQQVSLMRQSLESIDATLDDRRLRNTHDPQTATLRDKLQDLYDAESGRANILWEFVTRQRIATHRQENAVLEGQSSGNGRPPTPDPSATPTPFAMPSITGIREQDQRTMNAWGRSLSTAVNETESQSVGTFAVVAAGCS